MLGTWQNAIHVYIALSEFSRLKLLEGGLPAHKIAIKSNFAYPDPGLGAGTGRYAVFVGRLSAEKGVEALLQAWQHLGGRLPLKVVGDGPLATLVQEAAKRDTVIQWLGNLPLETVYNIVGGATFLVLPSQCYENFPRVVIEAFAKGTPVIVSKLGAMAEIVQDGHTGMHFRPGDPVDLADKVRSILTDPLRLIRMRQAARQKFEDCFTADVNYRNLAGIYARALDVRHTA
jgi:glycosyltransferase involved in cell wall biosynthesis